MENDTGKKLLSGLGGPGFKAALVGILLLVLLIPITMVQSLVNERSNRSNDVLAGVGATWGGEQQISGPILVLPYDHVLSRSSSGEEKLERRTLILLPDTLTSTGDVDVEKRAISIYETNVYTAHMKMKAAFQLPLLIDGVSPEHMKWDQLYVSLVLGDIQGLQGNMEIISGGKLLPIEPGTGLGRHSQGIHAGLGGTLQGGDSLAVDMSFSLRGTGALDIWPSGARTDVTLASGWPSPGFQGRFSPISHSISKDGFSAQWQTLRLAQGLGPVLFDGPPKGQSISVKFVDPVNNYSMTDRSAKYGSLFVLMTFAVLYLFEVISGRPVHPVQYMLTGLALCLFFMALLALSEHLDFGLAYGISATIVIAMVAAYGKSVMGSGKWTSGITITQIALFAYLYGVLKMEDLALLSGTALLFVALAVAMFLTRRVDWYRSKA
ncbi:cell envelope integrity protein CreD [Kordiimonas lacus]|uniref:Inner membrane protein n=1 Tax=Kordiimonas lacus TaxID=637679 RepID=A0A1G6ZM61_9PROT|nr:cell envelope integrity protein CreD [Kordiimonas lacus]SDE03914.1 inner membrane protein [Kordiimonas lacus]